MSTKEDRRRVGLYPDNRVAPLLKTVGGKSTARNAKTSARAAAVGNDSKKRKSDHDASDSDDSNNGNIRSQFDRGGSDKANDAEPAYVAGSYKGTAFRGAQRPKTSSRLVLKKTPATDQKPQFKSYAPIAANHPLKKKPIFNDYGAREKPVRQSSVKKSVFKTYAPSAPTPSGKPEFKDYSEKPAFRDYGAREKKPEKPVFNTYGGALNPHGSDYDEIDLSSLLRESPVSEIEEPPLNPDETKCPMCGTIVPLSLLVDFASQFPSVDPFAMRIQVQSRFCSHHRRHTAASSESYPPIEWSELPSRIRGHLPYIRTFLNDPDLEPSHYRDLLARDIAAGRNRTLMQSIMSDGARVRVPGYYGPRGARVMQDEILDVLSGELREAAIRDVVVSARGVGVYVTSVLVLEIGLLLMMDDLGVGREDARVVMEKSAAWGTLVNEEVEEVVEVEEEESDEFDW
ncbi:hypothetical protein VE03_03855 [Pseudogymnoascus sp. 23342-1-I1]|nr:hypothetical protein VE03_03855 [Pseudogymnoascus sp. 23342-1-I1]